MSKANRQAIFGWKHFSGWTAVIQRPMFGGQGIVFSDAVHIDRFNRAVSCQPSRKAQDHAKCRSKHTTIVAWRYGLLEQVRRCFAPRMSGRGRHGLTVSQRAYLVRSTLVTARCTVTVFAELQLGAMSSYSIAPSRAARCDPDDRNRAARGQRGTKS